MSEQIELAEQIAKGAPERCQGCYNLVLFAGELAEKVILGDMEELKAKTELGQDLGQNCRYGLVLSDGYSTNDTECTYGVTHRVPAPKPAN